MSSITVTILSDDQVMHGTWDLLSVEIHHAVDRIPRAELCLIDGDAPRREFDISNSTFFEPGRSIEIRIRREGEVGPGETSGEVGLFRGPVVRQRVTADGSGSTLRVEMRDPVLALTGVRHDRVFRDRSDREAISEILREAEIEEGSIPVTHPRHEELVQFYCTDWDFILSRADAQGLRAVVEAGVLSLAKPDVEGPAKRVLDWSNDTIYDFELEADTSRQLDQVEAIGWNSQTLRSSRVRQASEPKVDQGDLRAREVARKLGFGKQSLRHAAPMEAQELAAWANSRLARQRHSLVRGLIAIPGTGDLRLLDTIDVRGIGKQWNGRAPITGLHHRIDEDGWQTHIELGDSPEPFCHRDGILDAPAAGLLPAVRGLRIGIVADFAEDPSQELRLPVIVSSLGEESEPIWARLAAPMAGEDRGFVFRPEPGDEVVLGFLGDDPRHPVVLGSLHGSQQTAPAPFSPPTADNASKGITTKKGTILAFVDGDQASVRLETPKKNRLLLDDADEALVLEDQHGSSLRLAKGRLTLTSKGDIEIEAEGSISIKGKKVDLK